jgi:membrane carboxypeptidase/penicillin-binding protein PbpC
MHSSVGGLAPDGGLKATHCAAGSQQALQLKLSALGDSANQNSINASFERLGRYQLSVLDEAGQTARIEFSVVD